jgi:hypothetical protein
MSRLARAGDGTAAGECFIDYWAGRGSWATKTAERQRTLAARMSPPGRPKGENRRAEPEGTLMSTVAMHFDALFGARVAPVHWARLTMPVLCLGGAAHRRAVARAAALCPP